MHIVLLDIDGTLVLTGGAGQTAFAQTLAADFGIPQIETKVAFAGRSDRAIVVDLFRAHGISVSEENWQRFCAGYLSRLDDALANHKGYVLPGVGKFLSTVAARDDVGDDHLERCDIAAAALAAARLHLNGRTPDANAPASRPNGEIIVIGDTLHDITCGRSIGARCVAVATGHTPAAELSMGKPDVVVETLEDIDPVFALLNGRA
jgi:phosphoglycolate phosphatase